jgi:hypothetical protein
LKANQVSVLPSSACFSFVESVARSVSEIETLAVSA